MAPQSSSYGSISNKNNPRIKNPASILEGKRPIRRPMLRWWDTTKKSTDYERTRLEGGHAGPKKIILAATTREVLYCSYEDDKGYESRVD